MEIRYSRRMEYGDFLRATRLHENPSKLRSVVFMAGLAIGLSVIAWGAVAEQNWDRLTILVVMTLVFGPVLSFKRRRRWRRSAGANGPTSFVISEQAVEAENALGRSQVRWEAFSHATLAPDLVLLYAGGEPVPHFRKHFGSSGDWESFVKLVTQKVSRTR